MVQSSGNFGFDIDLSTNNDTFGNQYYGIENVVGGTQGDTITGDGANNILDGLAGADNLDGGAGNDLIYGGGGSDTVIGGEGADSLFAGAGDDVIYTGDAGPVVVDTGFNGISTIDAGAGNDHLHVTEIHNVINQFDGGDGIDTIYFDYDPAIHGGTTLRIRHAGWGAYPAVEWDRG